MVDSGKAVRVIRKAVRSAVTEAAEAALARVAEQEASRAPGAPAPKPPKVAEPTKPVEPLPPKPDQAGPDRRTATGAATPATPDDVAQQGRFLTTSTGARLRDTDHSLKAGDRGPTLLAGPPPAREDHALRPRAHSGARGPRARRRGARRLRRLRQRRAESARAGVPRSAGKETPRVRALLDRGSARAARRTPCGTPAASPRSSTPTRAPSTWSATTSRCSSSRTG